MFISPAVKKLCHSADEWFISEGSLGVLACEDKGVWRVTFFPSLREHVGGRRDGKKTYENFFIEIKNLMRVFDRKPSIQYDSGIKGVPPFMHLRGKIDGETFVVLIMPKPPPNSTPAEKVEGDKIKFAMPTIDELARQQERNV